MEGARGKRIGEKNKEKKRNDEDKKTKSDTSAFTSGSSLTNQTAETISVVGKSCNIGKSKSHESSYHLHECRSETALHPILGNQNFPNEGSMLPHSSLSCTSFISAESNLSNSKSLGKAVQDVEIECGNEDKIETLSRQQVPMKEQWIEFSPVSTEDDLISRLKEMEKKIGSKEKKIKDLSHQIDECNFSKSKKISENRSLTHQVNFLNRQLQSMYDLIKEKNWNQKIDPVEFLTYKNKTTELQSSVDKLEEEKEDLRAKVNSLKSDLNSKEKEMNAKNRELIDYKKRSTLEMCKLIKQIDELKREMKTQSQVFETKMSEAQNYMDDEIVTITTRLEDQYQKDLKSAVEKLHSNFEQLVDVPVSSVEKLLRVCESGDVDWPTLQRDWNREHDLLEEKILSMEAVHKKEMTHMKDSYETKIIFLKTQVESLSAQLQEGKEALDMFESELMIYKGYPEMKLPLSSVSADEVSSLKKLYKSEIFARNQVHQMETDVFEKRVKTLTEEILYRAKYEENNLQELQNARKVACIYREKYENLVVEWGERVQNNFEDLTKKSIDQLLDIDGIFDQMKNLIFSLRKAEEMHEERLKKLQRIHDEEISMYKRSVEFFKEKITELEYFQNDQLKLDGTIQELIENVGRNYVKTVEALVTSHDTELSLKQLEIFSAEKRYMDEMDFLKEDHQKQITLLRNELRLTEESKLILEKELERKNRNCSCHQRETEEITVELLKCEGMIAIKEETETALNERIRQLENLLEAKDENCRKEREGLMAKLIEAKVMSSAKDDLAKELEDKLTESGKLLDRSSRDVDNLFVVCSLLEENLRNFSSDFPTSRGDFTKDAELTSKFSVVRGNGEELKRRLLESFDKIDRLERGENEMVIKAKEEMSAIVRKLEKKLFYESKEKTETLEENNKLREKNSSLLELLAEKNRVLLEAKRENDNSLIKIEELRWSKEKEAEMKKKLEVLLFERDELMKRGQIVLAEKDELEERNKVLEEDLKVMNEKMEDLKKGKRSFEEGTFFIRQEVNVLYEEETTLQAERSGSVACQAEAKGRDSLQELLRENEELTEENKILREELMKKCSAEGMMNREEIISNFKKKLSDVMVERNGWMTISKKLEREKQCLREEIEVFREENRTIRERFEAELNLLEDKTDDCPFSLAEEPSPKKSKSDEMKNEIGQLSNYIKTLSAKLEDMKTNNEKLLTESNEHLRNNQSLTNELEEAWVQRYEIEDQLAKVRRENALLNLHRAQLEDTNRRISNLIGEGKPSVISWIKIHETVETIVDEVLALKTAFADSGANMSLGEESENSTVMKSTAEIIRNQTQNKTIPCDELLSQKKTLEKELENLEELLKENDSRILTGGRFEERSSGSKGRHSEDRGKQKSRIYSMEMAKLPQESELAAETCEETHLRNLNLLKKHLENQIDLEEAQFRENLEQKIHGLKKEMGKLEKGKSLGETEVDREEEDALISIEKRYEEEVAEAAKDFDEEVKKVEGMMEGCDGEGREKFVEKLERMKQEFGAKREALERKYDEKCDSRRRKRLTSDLEKEREQIMSRFRKMVHRKETAERETELETFINSILNKYIEEIKSLKEKRQENSWKLASDVEISRDVINRPNEREEEEEKSEMGDEIGFSDSTKQTKEDRKKWEILEMEEFCGERLKKWRKKGEKSVEECSKGNGKNEVEYEMISDRDKVDSGKMKKIPSRRDLDADTQEYIKNLEEQICFLLEKNRQQETIKCSSCSCNKGYFDRTEVITDDDKLEIVRERDFLKEMVSSLRLLVIKLLTFAGSDVANLSARDFNSEETMYKSLLIVGDRDQFDSSILSSKGSKRHAFDLSSIIQEINDHSLLNSSGQFRFELDKCLKQVNKDAAGLLALSIPGDPSPFCKIIENIEKGKSELEKKVQEIEESQAEIKKEIGNTKEKLAQWERNIEVVSEGYGEEVVEPVKIISVMELKEKIKSFISEYSVHSSQEANLLEEIFKESYRLQEEWKREKIDLQQQIDVADKQLHSLRKFMEEQAAERELEREGFDMEISNLRENLKVREKDNFLQIRTNREVDALESQVKDLTTQMNDAERSKKSVESEFQNAVKKIWSLREVIQDLEVQLAETNERESNLKKKVERLDALLEEQVAANKNLKEEFESIKRESELKYKNHIENLEEERVRMLRVFDQFNPDSLARIKSNLREMETVIVKKTKDFEQLHISSANVSCSSPSEDVSIRDHFDATRCSTPDEMCGKHQEDVSLPMEEVDRLQDRLTRHVRAEEIALKYIQDLKMQLRSVRKSLQELQTERDILLERVDTYLRDNSSLKARLEEQRCNAAFLQKQLNADLESQINRLETDVEKLNELCIQKDKQLQDMKEILENTTKALKTRETEAMNKSREEKSLISTLKTDLANTLVEKEKLEESLERAKEKLRTSFKLPALIDSMIEEKNAEIDRLEKEVSRLSSERSSPIVEESKFSKKGKRIKFSEPESFGDHLSTISPCEPSIMRNCNDSCGDFRNSSFKLRHAVDGSKIESLSSIGPLQLSPRGMDRISGWKMSSPLVPHSANSPVERKSTSSQTDEEESEESKLREQIESKEREMSEFKLEIDIVRRQLVEVDRELESSKLKRKEIQSELEAREEEIRKLKISEANLIMTMESLKRNHLEEIEEFRNKLNFERGKVEKVYGEIESLEMKKIEIEEAFLSLKEEYNEKLEGEQNKVKKLVEKIRDLELENCTKKDTENSVEERTIEKMTILNRELFPLKKENELVKSEGKIFADAEVQADENWSENRRKSETLLEDEAKLVIDDGWYPPKENFEKLKEELDKMTETIWEVEFGRKEAFDYLHRIRNLLSSVFGKMDDLVEELETRRRQKTMESSVDDLAHKVKKELILSAKLDKELFSSIRAKELESEKISVSEEVGGGDGVVEGESEGNDDKFLEVTAMYQEARKKIASLEEERNASAKKVHDLEKIVEILEENVAAERERIMAEKERCKEDAKIMELLRVNLEKVLKDIKAKDGDLRKEKELRATSEREAEDLRKRLAEVAGSNKVSSDLNSRLKLQEEKILSLAKSLEMERKKNQELGLSLDKIKMERNSEKEAQRFLETDFNLLTEQKENLKVELINAKKIIHSRDKEINLLKRRINVQEIDMKVLSLATNLQQESSPSESSLNIGGNKENVAEEEASRLPKEGISRSLLHKMKKLNTCVQRHVEESNEMGQVLLHLSEETEQMRDFIRKLEENAEVKSDEGISAVERKLWALEKGKLLMDFDALKTERDLARRNSLEAWRNSEILKVENSKLKSEIESLEREANSLMKMEIFKDQFNQIRGKYLRAESYRKALIWQKQYLVRSLNGFRTSEEEAWERMGKSRKLKKRESKGVRDRFKIVALAVKAVFRMKFIVKRWQRYKVTKPVSESQPIKQTSLESVLGSYAEPVNPLAYQTRNLFRESSTGVQKSPPSRDPGLQNRRPDRKTPMEI